MTYSLRGNVHVWFIRSVERDVCVLHFRNDVRYVEVDRAHYLSMLSFALELKAKG